VRIGALVRRRESVGVHICSANGARQCNAAGSAADDCCAPPPDEPVRGICHTYEQSPLLTRTPHVATSPTAPPGRQPSAMRLCWGGRSEICCDDAASLQSHRQHAKAAPAVTRRHTDDGGTEQTNGARGRNARCTAKRAVRGCPHGSATPKRWKSTRAVDEQCQCATSVTSLDCSIRLPPPRSYYPLPSAASSPLW